MNQQMNIPMAYGYKGAACCEVTVREYEGVFQVSNNYGERMYSGGVKGYVGFMKDILDGKYV